MCIIYGSVHKISNCFTHLPQLLLQLSELLLLFKHLREVLVFVISIGFFIWEAKQILRIFLKGCLPMALRSFLGEFGCV